MKKIYAFLFLAALCASSAAVAESSFEEYSKIKKGMFLSDEPVAENPFDQSNIEGIKTYNRSAKSVMSIEQIVAAYNEGRYIEIIDAVKSKAEEDSPVAQKILGKMYKEEKGVDKNPKEAARWFAIAADAGDSEAQYLLGSMLYAGDGIDKDVISALKWLKISSLLESDTAKKAATNDEYFKVLSNANRREKTEAAEQTTEWLRNKGKLDLLKNSTEVVQ